MRDIMGNICERAQGNLWGLYREYLWEANNMENIWVIYGEYLYGLKIIYGLVWDFLRSGLMKLGSENPYLNKHHHDSTPVQPWFDLKNLEPLPFTVQ